MKPKRYPYSCRMNHPTMTITKKTLAYIDPIVKVDCKRSNDVEFKSDGVVFNKKSRLINISSMAKAMEEFGKAYQKFVTADKNEREIQEATLKDITSRIEKCEMTLKGLEERKTNMEKTQLQENVEKYIELRKALGEEKFEELNHTCSYLIREQKEKLTKGVTLTESDYDALHSYVEKYMKN